MRAPLWRLWPGRGGWSRGSEPFQQPQAGWFGPTSGVGQRYCAHAACRVEAGEGGEAAGSTVVPKNGAARGPGDDPAERDPEAAAVVAFLLAEGDGFGEWRQVWL